jgi:ubiquitin C-terminal hydrolase
MSYLLWISALLVAVLAVAFHYSYIPAHYFRSYLTTYQLYQLGYSNLINCIFITVLCFILLYLLYNLVTDEGDKYEEDRNTTNLNGIKLQARHKNRSKSLSDAYSTVRSFINSIRGAPSSLLISKGVSGKPLVQGGVGLLNLGNTCYMNSVLQALSCVEELNEFLRDQPRLETSLKLAFESKQSKLNNTSMDDAQGLLLQKRRKENINNKSIWSLLSPSAISTTTRNTANDMGETIRTYASLVEDMWSNQWIVVAPRALHKIIGKRAPRFAALEQQDCTEFLSELLDILHEDLAISDEGSSNTSNDVKTGVLLSSSLPPLPPLPSTPHSIITDLFRGMSHTFTSCTCGHTVTTPEPFFCLPLALPRMLHTWKVRIVGPQIQPGYQTKGDYPKDMALVMRVSAQVQQPATIGMILTEIKRKIARRVCAFRKSLIIKNHISDTCTSTTNMEQQDDDSFETILPGFDLALTVVSQGLIKEVLTDKSSTQNLTSENLVGYLYPPLPLHSCEKETISLDGKTRSGSCGRVLSEFNLVKIVHRVQIFDFVNNHEYRRHPDTVHDSAHWIKAVLGKTTSNKEEIDVSLNSLKRRSIRVNGKQVRDFFHPVCDIKDIYELPDQIPKPFHRVQALNGSLPLLLRVIEGTRPDEVLQLAYKWAHFCKQSDNKINKPILTDKKTTVLLNDFILPNEENAASFNLPFFEDSSDATVNPRLVVVNSIGNACGVCTVRQECDGCADFLVVMDAIKTAEQSTSTEKDMGKNDPLDSIHSTIYKVKDYQNLHLGLDWFSEKDFPQSLDHLRLNKVWKEYNVLNEERKKRLPEVKRLLQEEPERSKLLSLSLPDPMSVIPHRVVSILTRGLSFSGIIEEIDDNSKPGDDTPLTPYIPANGLNIRSQDSSSSSSSSSSPPPLTLDGDIDIDNNLSTDPLIKIKKMDMQQMATKTQQTVTETTTTTTKAKLIQGNNIKGTTPQKRSRLATDHETELSLANCLDLFTAETALETSERWICPNCNRKVRAKRSTVISKPPTILAVSFKRFLPLDDFGSTIKVDDLVTYPLCNFDLSPWTTTTTTSAETKMLSSTTSTSTTGTSTETLLPLYDLFAVLKHSGVSADAGHYTTDAMNPITKKWLHFNDERVVEIGEGELVTSSAYVLFYKRQGSYI